MTQQQTQANLPLAMSQTSRMAVDRAVRLLQVAGVMYHIVLPDGSSLGEPIKASKKGYTRRASAGPNNGPLIADLFYDLEPGQTKLVRPQEGDTAKRLARCIMSAAGRYVGSAKNVVVAVTATGAVEVLRIE